MDDYSALAQRISVSVREVRGCFILSREGMVLGAYPDEDESLAKAAWLRFVALGEPEKSFVEFTDQTWAYVRRGPYAAFAVADHDVRPGILVDQLDLALMTAEEQRTRRDSLKVPDAPSAPSGKPRTSMHPTGKDKPVEVTAEVTASPKVSAAASGDDRRKWSRGTPKGAGASSSGAPSGKSKQAEKPGASSPSAKDPGNSATAPAAQTPVAPSSDEQTALRKEPQKLASGSSSPGDEETEVDRVLLAKEFSGLLQLDSADDEGSS